MEKKNIRIQKGKKGMSRIRRNSELELQYNSQDIILEIKARKLDWLGHAVKMKDNRKKSLNLKLEGRRKPGRFKLR